MTDTAARPQLRPPAVPLWVSIGLIPIVNLVLALLVSGLVVMVIGENPLDAVGYLVSGAFGYHSPTGYTLHSPTHSVFPALAVALASPCGLLTPPAAGRPPLAG